MADLASTRVFGRLTVMHEAILRANAEMAGATMSDRLVIDNSSYDRHILLKRGSLEFPITITTAGSGRGRLMGGDWEVSSGDLLVDGTISGDGSGLTGTANNLRARSTTKGDVGLGNVRNVESYAKSDFSSDDDSSAPMVRNGSGDVWCRLFRSSYSQTNSNIDGIYTTREIGGDYMRPSTPSQVKSALNISKSDVGLSNVRNEDVLDYGLGSDDLDGTNNRSDDDISQIKYAGFFGTDSNAEPYGHSSGISIPYRRDGSGSNQIGHYLIFSTSDDPRASIATYRNGDFTHRELLHKGNSDSFNSSGNYSGLRARATTKSDVGLSNIPNSTTASRTSSSSSSLLEARAMNSHRTSGDHDSRYVRKSGDSMTGELELDKFLSNGQTILKLNAHRRFAIERKGGSNETNASLALVSKTSGNSWAIWHNDDFIVDFGTGNEVEFKKSIYSHGNITAYSDLRLKENIETIGNALDKVCAISGYTYDREGLERGRQTGVIAQEVLEVLPEAVFGGPTEEDPDKLYSVAYGNMVGLLVEAIKEERSKRESLEDKVSKLEEIIYDSTLQW